jgi:acetylornithine deacetylase/succinyl-diaminopimelate desuccinylase-like protein
LDNLYDLALRELGEKKAAKKILKVCHLDVVMVGLTPTWLQDLVKIVVKLALLYQKSQFNQKELGA